MEITARLNPNASPDKQKAFEKIKHEVTTLHVTSGAESHDYEIAFLPDGMTSLKALHCENNGLTFLPSDMISLEHLCCQNNQLTSLPSDMSCLKTLSCEDNQLTSLPDGMATLWILYCQNNHIRFLPDDMEFLFIFSSDFTELGGGNQAQAYQRLREEDNLPFRSSMKSAR